MTVSDAWLGKHYAISTLESYEIRSRILRALRADLFQFEGTVLDVGCGYMPFRSLLTKPPSRALAYVGLDLEAGTYATRPDLTWDGRQIPLPTGSVDSALATEVLEHCSDPVDVLTEVARVLKPGGFFFLTVPFIWPLHDVPHDMYRFTPFSLERLLLEAGFDAVEVNGLGGWDASLAQMIALWTRRRPMGRFRRLIFSICALPMVKVLSGLDRSQPVLGESQMITGLSASARKAR